MLVSCSKFHFQRYPSFCPIAALQWYREKKQEFPVRTILAIRLSVAAELLFERRRELILRSGAKVVEVVPDKVDIRRELAFRPWSMCLGDLGRAVVQSDCGHEHGSMIGEYSTVLGAERRVDATM